MLKRFLALLMSLVFVLISCTSLTATGDTVTGDVNGDGAIDQFDYILVKRHYFETIVLEDDELLRADVNGDDVVNQFDYILIKRHYFGTYTIDSSGSTLPPADDPEQVPNIVSYGKTYTVSYPADDKYIDSYNCELTDGIYNLSTSYTSGYFAGFNSSFNVVMDLEDDGESLKFFEVSYLSVDEAGIYIPASITVYASNDKNNWTSLGNMHIPVFVNGMVMSATLELEDPVSYRYIRFDLARYSAWIFLDEILIESSIPKYSNDGAGEIFNQYLTSAASDKSIQENIASVTTGNAVNVSKGSTSVSKGKTYKTNSTSYDSRAPYSNTLLTDGAATGAALEQNSWIGFDSKKDFYVTVDLGTVRNDIYAFSAHAFKRNLSKITLPDYADVYVSSNGSNFVNIGRCYATYEKQENFAYTLILRELISARYVRFNFCGGGEYTWLEEISVLANYTDTTADPLLYGEFDFPTTSTPAYWPNGIDYNTEKNLIKGLPQQIVSDVSLGLSEYGENNTGEDSTLLTDGKTTTNDYCYSGEWFHFNRGEARRIFYDIGKISSVSSFSLHLLEYEEWAICLPSNIKLALSENGEDWYLAYNTTVVSDGNTIQFKEYTLDKAYRARYVMVYLDVECHVFLDEISVNGKKNVQSAAALTSLPEFDVMRVVNSNNGYAAPSEDVLGGVRDVCLIYHNSITTDEAYFRPYVGYVDKNGNIIDTMFDGYLFLPSTGELPSGGRPYGTNYASDWNYLFDELFASGINFDALNKTAETTKKALGLSELKLKVFVTIPHMDTSLYNFGDIDLDGKNDPLTTLNGRVYVAKAYAQRVIKEFNARGYKNLELCGFYWFHEEISGDDVQTAIDVNAMFDKLGYPLFWIPYYNAAGYSHWEEYGFDVACYQPNYAFHIDVDSSRLKTATDEAKRFGMCIELELDSASFSDKRFFQKYMDYLNGGVKYGYMDNAIHMYYLGSDDMGKASRTSVERLRLIYDYTYQFIKGTLTVELDAVAKKSFNASYNAPFAGTVAGDSGDVVYYRLASSPEHGTVTLSENGKFVYYPNKGFKGTDTFTYYINNYVGESEECTVTIEVK